MKIDLDKKLVIVSTNSHVAESMIDDLRKWDLISKRPEVIERQYKLRTCRNTRFITMPPIEVSYNRDMRAMYDEIEGQGWKQVQFPYHSTREQFCEAWMSVYGDEMPYGQTEVRSRQSGGRMFPIEEMLEKLSRSNGENGQSMSVKEIRHTGYCDSRSDEERKHDMENPGVLITSSTEKERGIVINHFGGHSGKRAMAMMGHVSHGTTLAMHLPKDVIFLQANDPDLQKKIAMLDKGATVIIDDVKLERSGSMEEAIMHKIKEDIHEISAAKEHFLPFIEHNKPYRQKDSRSSYRTNMKNNKRKKNGKRK